MKKLNRVTVLVLAAVFAGFIATSVTGCPHTNHRDGGPSRDNAPCH